MDYTKEMLRLFKQGPGGMEVYNISVSGQLITVESGPMGRPGHKVLHPLADKPRVDRMVQGLLEKGYAPLEKTFGPWAIAKKADQMRAPTRAKRKLGGGF